MAHANAPTSRFRRWAVLSVAGLAVAVVIGGSVVALRQARPEPAGPIVWDGIQWVPIDVEGFGRPTTFVSDMAVGRSGVIAWGETARDDPNRPGEVLITTLLWQSPDGVGWRASAFPTDGGRLFVPSVVAESGTGWLAHGRNGPDDVGLAGLWSSDGDAWTATVLPDDLGVTENLVGLDTGFVTIGLTGDRPVAWSSVDGSAWTREEIPAPPGIIRAGGLTTADGDVLLAGYLETETDFDALIWRRDPEGRWTRLGDADPELVGADRGATVYRVLAVGDRLLAIGSAGEIPACSLSGRVASLGARTADHCPGLPPATWISGDGEAWRPVAPPRPRGLPRGMEFGLYEAEPGIDGLVLIINERPLENDPRFGVWTTADGERWRRVADGMPAMSAQFVAGLPGRLVVVGGTRDGSPGVWLGNAPPVD